MLKEETPNDEQKKWMISLISAVVFVLVSTPQTFKFTNDIFEKYFCIKTIDEFEKPTWSGIFLHALVFMLITRFLMNYKLHDYFLEGLKKKNSKIM